MHFTVVLFWSPFKIISAYGMNKTEARILSFEAVFSDFYLFILMGAFKAVFDAGRLTFRGWLGCIRILR